MSPRIVLSAILSIILLVSCANLTDIETVSQPTASSGGMPGSTLVATREPINETDVSGTPVSYAPIHLMRPEDIVPVPGVLVDDVESSGTGAEGRAPYGDSLDLNRFERPFLEDMTYIPDLDIHKFGISQDEDWYYISIGLIGNDPNNAVGINYGVEIDLNADGFGDYIIWAHPPYTTIWDTGTVEVYEDSDHDSGGVSSKESDAVFNGNGYETLIFDGGSQQNADPDLAWVRLLEGQNATIQFAFKKPLSGPSFMFGVVSDAGLRDVSRFDYSDYFTEADAGSPVKGKPNFPLGSLYAVDNTCWEAYGFKSTGYEPKVCPVILQPVIKPSGNDQPAGCNPPPDCDGYGGGAYDPVTCECR
jgi:hypothetical protein